MAASVLVACLLLGPGSVRAGDDKAGAAAGNDYATNRKIYENLRHVINRGADLYNRPTSDWDACYRLYEGALLMTRPFLDHEPELQKDIDAGINAGRTATRDQRAFVLREVIDKIRSTVSAKLAPPVVVSPPRPRPDTLWGRLGEKENFTKIVDDFVTAVLADPKVNFDRGGKFKFGEAEVKKLKDQLVDLGSSVSGGPKTYKGKAMLELHKGMDISGAEFDALLGHLKAALARNGVKPTDADEVLKKVEATRKSIVEK
jgi:hemoglobin